jgi:predicted naringenin-chalcone synthase
MYLSHFRNDLSTTPIPQAKAIEWLAAQHSIRSGLTADKLVKMLERFGCSPEQIQQRRVWLPEFTAFGIDHLFPVPPTQDQPQMAARMQTYTEQMTVAVNNLYETETKEPSHLLHVTCTGYTSPSLAQNLVLHKNWQTVVQHIYHMGCYAAIPAVRTARGLIATEPNASVDILHTEFCTLHADLNSSSPEQLVVQSLFADACIRYRMSAQPTKGQNSFSLISTHEMLIPGSASDMTWDLANFGFSMTLSRMVPEKVGRHLKSFLEILFKKANLDISDLYKMTVAIHPGGPKIIDSIQKILELNENQITASRKVLYENGNMSSATLPFIWKETLEQLQPMPSPYVLSLAFGPGLTIAGNILCLHQA